MHERPYECVTGAVTFTYPLFTVVFPPPAFAAVRLTSYVPAVVYVCVGFWSVEFAGPSPNDHDHDVGEPVEVSVNWTGSAAGPDVTFEVKSPTGVTRWIDGETLYSIIDPSTPLYTENRA